MDPFDGDGIFVSTTRLNTPVTIINAGSILVTENGIEITAITLDPADTTTWSITNNGSIETVGDGFAAIKVDDFISAAGTITIENNAGAIIKAAGDDAIAAGNNTVLNNHGNIIALDGTLVNSDAIDFGSHPGGVVNNFSDGTMQGARYGITGNQAFIVTNSGTITGGDGAAIGAFGGSTITNDGTIASANGVAILAGGNFIDTITNSGTIIGKVSTGDGNDVFDLHTGSSISGVVDAGLGTDTVNLNGGGAGIFATFIGIEFINLNDGDWIIDSEGVTAIAFGIGSQTLRLTSGVLSDHTFTGIIDNFAIGDVIDLQRVGVATSATLGAGNLLTVSGTPGGPILLQLDGGEDYTGQVFLVTPDGSDGTLIRLDTAPVFTSAASFSVAENDTFVGIVTAHDPEVDAVTFALAGGTDASFFAIDPGTGELTFITSPDFETPEDSGTNNVYDVIVSATDALGAVSAQSIAVAITDVVEVGQTISGGNGSQSIVGSSANDTINAGNGNDTISAGDGNDNVASGNGNDNVVAGRGNDTVEGGNGNDNVNGDTGNDVLTGSNGTDILDGGDGNDNLGGGNGNDRLIGGLGDDILNGGNANDVFAFGASFGHDIVMDFGHGDQIEFDDHLFANFAAVQAASQQVGGDVVVTFDALNSVTLQHVLLSSLHASDFFLT